MLCKLHYTLPSQREFGPPVVQLKFTAFAFQNFALAYPPTPLLFSLASNAFPDIGTVGRIEKKNHKKSPNRRLWFPMTLKVNIHIFGSTKCTIYRKKCSCFCSCFSLRCYYAHFSDYSQTRSSVPPKNKLMNLLFKS